MSILYRNWFVHNMFAHPLHELVYRVLRLLMFGGPRARRISDYIHDVTVPKVDAHGHVQPPEVESFVNDERQQFSDDFADAALKDKVETESGYW
jgi:hypothetical protein